MRSLKFVLAILVLSAAQAWGDDKNQSPSPVTGEQVISVQPSTTLSYWDSLRGQMPRQALLITVREELGRVARDEVLERSLPAGDGTTLKVALDSKKPRFVLQIEVPGEKDFKDLETFGVTHKEDSESLDTCFAAIEGVSREEYVVNLKRQGIEGKPVPWTDAPLPTEVETLINEMNFISQYQAIRTLHHLTRSQGNSPALLGGLVRAYGNLGWLSEHHWSMTSYNAKAASILYAERLLTHPGLDEAFCRRQLAYALAVAGMNRKALKELDKADELLTKSEKKETLAPSWVENLRRFCEFDTDALGEVSSNDATYQLAHMLRVISIEQQGSNSYTLSIAPEECRRLPECYRIQDIYCEHAGPGPGREATSMGFEIVRQTLYKRISELPGLPPAIQAITRESELLDPNGDSHEGEFRLRARLTQALLDAQSTGDEFSWSALGQLIQELSFCQTTRLLSFEHHQIGGPVDEEISPALLLVGNHPCRAYLKTYSSDDTQARQGILGFIKDTPRARINSRNFFRAETPIMNKQFEQTRTEWWHQVVQSTPRYTSELYFYALINVESERLQWGRRLSEVCPQSPYARALLVAHDWDKHSGDAAEWEKTGTKFPALLIALGNRYMQLKQLDDAERCYQEALAHDPSGGTYQLLAGVYWQKGDKAKWLATLQDFLQQPEVGLSHSQVRVSLANYYTSLGEWEKALPYADQAAGSGAAWAMLTAAKIHEVLQEWPEAEEYYQMTSMQYDSSVFEWYFFCKRTGQGDAATAQQFITNQFRNIATDGQKVSASYRMTYLLLSGATEEAEAASVKYFEDSHNPYLGLLGALADDELKHAERRDALLRSIKEDGAKYAPEDLGGKPREQIIALANLLSADLQQGGHADFDAAALEKIRAAAEPFDQMAIDYFLGKYYSLHGKPAEAIVCWKKCMPSVESPQGASNLLRSLRTLAGAALWERGTTPAEYKEAMRHIRKMNPVAEKDSAKNADEQAK